MGSMASGITIAGFFIRAGIDHFLPLMAQPRPIEAALNDVVRRSFVSTMTDCGGEM